MSYPLTHVRARTHTHTHTHPHTHTHTPTLDLARDILKSDTASVDIPEAFLNLGEGTLGGRFTTIEGLLVQVKDQLRGQFDLHTKARSGVPAWSAAIAVLSTPPRHGFLLPPSAPLLV